MQYKLSELVSEIAKLSLSKGETIMVHSALHCFGMPNVGTKVGLCNAIYRQLKSMIGEEGTIAVPTFNFSFCSGKLYDIKRTPSQGMGIFSEYIRELENSIRSKHPTQSISVIGQHASDICFEDSYSAFEKKSSFAKLVSLDATVLLIGAPIQAVSFIHLAEEHNLVPYRYYKTFNADYCDNEGCVTEKSYGMYVRDLSTNPILKLNKIEKVLEEKGQIKKITFKTGKISQFKAVNFLDIVNEKLKKNPNWLIEDR